ncbi:MAG: hypothetical protein MRQ13_03870 [Candidatus Midichloria sp.]|nr:hypothetical protein [Candidatus Midichloria sp.]
MYDSNNPGIDMVIKIDTENLNTEASKGLDPIYVLFQVNSLISFVFQT